MAVKLSLKPERSDFKSLAVGLFGVIAAIVAFLLTIALTSSVAYDLGCQEQIGCSLPGFVLGLLLWFVLTPIALKRYLLVQRPVLVVVCSTIGLLIAYSIASYEIEKYLTYDNLSWFVLAFAILNGVLFMVLNVIGDSLSHVLAPFHSSRKQAQIIGGVLAAVALILIYFLVNRLLHPG